MIFFQSFNGLTLLPAGQLQGHVTAMVTPCGDIGFISETNLSQGQLFCMAMDIKISQSMVVNAAKGPVGSSQFCTKQDCQWV